MLIRQLSIDEVPLGLERAPEDRIASLLGRRFQLIESCLRLQRSDIGGREVESRKFGHLVRGRIINTADQHTNMAHRALLGHYKRAMLPQLAPVPDYNLTQPLFALTLMVAQQQSLVHLIPLVIDQHGYDPLSAGDYYLPHGHRRMLCPDMSARSWRHAWSRRDPTIWGYAGCVSASGRQIPRRASTQQDV